MSSRLTISLITPSFNQAPFIERTLRSVLDQQGDFDLDYRVLDGGSSDGTVDILRRQDARVQWSSGPDGGQIEAINRGLREARGDIVGWLNSDDLLLPGALQRVATAFAAHPQVEWVHGRCRIIDAEDRPIREWISRYKHYRARRHSFSSLLSENYVSQMTTFWRRRVHEQVGYLDPSLELAFDYEFWLRLARRSPPLYIDDCLACFRWYDSSKSGANYARQFAEAAEIARRHGPDAPAMVRLGRRLKGRIGLTAYRLLDRLRSGGGA